MSFGQADQNLLIGLRDGLETGLVISLLLAALKRLTAAATASEGRHTSSSPMWLGVLGAIMSAGSCAAVLTYSSDALSPPERQVAEGLLGVVAAGLVTGEMFWMQRLTRALPGEPPRDASRVIAVGSGGLTAIALVVFGRGALDTMSSVWPALRASGATSSPTAGILAGLATASALCWLAYRQTVRLDFSAVFTRAGVAVFVIAAGLLGDGVGRLQVAGWLPGGHATAFDVRSVVNPGSCLGAIFYGVTVLSPRMGVAEVGVWAAFALVVVPVFLARCGRVAVVASSPFRPTGREEGPAGRSEGLTTRRTWSMAGALVAAPCLAAAVVILALPANADTPTTSVTVTQTTCASDWVSGHSGTQRFQVANTSQRAGEVDLINSSGGVVSWIEVIGPGTTVPMIATLGPGQYQFVCHMFGGTLAGAMVPVVGQQRHLPIAVTRVTLDDMKAANAAYQRYASGELSTLADDVTTLHAALAGGDLDAARQAWLPAQLDWELVGASYNSFGDAGLAVDGLPDGLPGGVDDPDFTGLHRIEYGLYHGQSAATLLPIADQLSTDITTIRKNLGTNDEAGDPTQLSVRVHEVLEDALRDHLSGLDDQGSGMAYAETYADTQVTRTLLGEVASLLEARVPGDVDSVDHLLDRLGAALLATKTNNNWQPPSALSLSARQRVDAAVGAVLEALRTEPNLLKVPPNHCVRDPTSPINPSGGKGSAMLTTAPSPAPSPAPSQAPWCAP